MFYLLLAFLDGVAPSLLGDHHLTSSLLVYPFLIRNAKWLASCAWFTEGAAKPTFFISPSIWAQLQSKTFFASPFAPSCLFAPKGQNWLLSMLAYIHKQALDNLRLSYACLSK
jgi:hypothetical protein